jgi:hypothetical protein
MTSAEIQVEIDKLVERFVEELTTEITRAATVAVLRALPGRVTPDTDPDRVSRRKGGKRAPRAS